MKLKNRYDYAEQLFNRSIKIFKDSSISLPLRKKETFQLRQRSGANTQSSKLDYRDSSKVILLFNTASDNVTKEIDRI